MQTEGVDIRSVGNTAVSQTIAIIILYSLKIVTEYEKIDHLQ